jgi:hypothetical protein
MPHLFDKIPNFCFQAFILVRQLASMFLYRWKTGY